MNNTSKNTLTTSFDGFAQEYDKKMGDTGDVTHMLTIDPALFEIIGSVKNKVVYDIGCGNGYIARRYIKEKAKEVWASDISKELIKIAKTKYDATNIKYSVQPGEDFTNIPTSYFDVISMNMVIHYIKDLDSFFEKTSAALKTGGIFVFTTDHPLHSHSYHDISKENNAAEIVKAFKNYTKETSVEFPNMWGSKQYLKIYQRPFSHYINLLSKHKLYTFKLIEPATKRLDRYESNELVSSDIPFKFAMGAVKVDCRKSI